ncbi:DUF4142 domain-containing protein [Pedobacter deserti]|uniref:DUF4142 domain-containing protein n=1 Tax=Pedobacter deserti TaxID=2817382 RepID=UPI00210A53B1|nr:DUF4142 domain-containing protein [Pedobacter sp. SYSU D00382]
MKTLIQNPRRDFLSTSLKGSLLVMAGMSSVTLLQSFAPAEADQSEAAFRSQLGLLGSLSLMTSEIAVRKAMNPKVKLFAKCEVAEQTALATVLKDLNTPIPAMDAKGQAIIEKLNAASGAAFDKAFMQAQHETHQQLKSLTGDFIKSTEGKTGMPDKHTRHIATVSHPTITEHTEKSKMLLGELA